MHITAAQTTGQRTAARPYPPLYVAVAVAVQVAGWDAISWLGAGFHLNWGKVWLYSSTKSRAVTLGGSPYRSGLEARPRSPAASTPRGGRGRTA